MPRITTSQRRRNRVRLEKARFELQQAVLERKRAHDPSNMDIIRMERRIDRARMEIARIEQIIEITERKFDDDFNMPTINTKREALRFLGMGGSEKAQFVGPGKTYEETQEKIEKVVALARRIIKAEKKMDYIRDQWTTISDDTVQSTSFDDCVGKMISHLSDAHPEMEHDQVVAAAHEKCREKHGGRKPKG